MEEKERFEILLENIESKVRLIAEGHSVLSRQIQESSEKAEKAIQETRIVLGVSIDRLDKKVDTVEQELKGEINGVRQELRETREELGGKIDRVAEIVEDHSRRISRLEERVLV